MHVVNATNIAVRDDNSLGATRIDAVTLTRCIKSGRCKLDFLGGGVTRRSTYRNLSLPPMSSSCRRSKHGTAVCSFDSVIKAALMVYSDDHTGERAELLATDGLTRFSRVTCSFS